MYQLSYNVDVVKGIGDTLAEQLQEKGVETVLDLLLTLPLHYQDNSQRAGLTTAPYNELFTFEATVLQASQYYKGRRSIQRAVIQDESGKRKVMWFNNRFILQKLKTGESYLFSGKINDRGVLMQPLVEDVKVDTIHTDRIIPLYSSKFGIKIGTLRRLLKEVIDNLTVEDWLEKLRTENQETTNRQLLPPLKETFQQLHFPDSEESVIQARERLALEELLGLISHSHHLKQTWQDNQSGVYLQTRSPEGAIPDDLPFSLTAGQQKAIKEIITDLQSSQPMNRLLIGDVGSGKTVVAGIAMNETVRAGKIATLIAPTQILAEQHFTTLTKLFPDLEIELLTGSHKPTPKPKPHFIVGTHAILNQLKTYQPALIIFDEQHRFGVKQRSSYLEKMTYTPHILTMTATPIPRSLMLTLFSHLQISQLTEMPAGRKPIKTWLTPDKKRQDAYQWISKHLTKNNSQIIHVCPFIDPSEKEQFEHVASAKETATAISTFLKKENLKLKPGLLHGKLSNKQKDKVTEELFNENIDWLITTPVVEVGLDLPGADIIIIEGAERFGLASLHQLRGRVGRAGQQGYCILFTSQEKHFTSERLNTFTQENNGLKLAEQDLKNRGAGNIFGTQQHGLSELRFANWANLELITTAKSIYDDHLNDTQWQPLFSFRSEVETAAN